MPFRLIVIVEDEEGKREGASLLIQHDMRTKVISALSVIGLALTLCGCFGNNPSFPVVWPPLQAKMNIENSIAGSYSCSSVIAETAGAQKDSPRQRCLIGGFLFGGDPPPSCDHFEIGRVSANEIEIRLLSQGREVLRKSYLRNRDFHVEDGWIIFESIGNQWILAPDLLGFVWKTPQITLDDNLDLIGKKTNSLIGTMLIIFPIGYSDSEWFKFARIE